MLLLPFTILLIFGAATSQNHDVNSQTPYKGKIVQRTVEATNVIPPDPKVDDEGMRLLLNRLETLCVEKLEYLITDTNKRFESLENQTSEVRSTVNFMREELGQIQYPLTSLENLLLEKLDNLTTEVGRLSQCCSTPATPVVPINENLEVIVEDSSEDVQLVADTTKNLPSDVEAVKPNVSNSMVDSSSNLESEQILNEGLPELKDLKAAPSTSDPLHITQDRQSPKNCKEVGKSGEKASGIYTIQPDQAPKPFEAFCDLETKGGDWTVIQRRFDGSQDFYLGWEDYKNGFGNLRGEFWLGLENIHLLTGNDENELLIELGNFKLQNRSALYSRFSVGSEMEGYPLKTLDGYSGDAGDSMGDNVGAKFTTKDMDQDSFSGNCAHHHGGAWWYKACTLSNLNGEYFNGGEIPPEIEQQGIFWNKFHLHRSGLKYTRMLVRPKV